ncbi:venom serine carboxypeptidase-like [Bacillus rossius redtenbacheri]|uniref:venom serine carboxypeptidase-like n=1 Tax=Bacillus rossius redtenbacheri TaxID=93214 RepID=UPI002FDDBB64
MATEALCLLLLLAPALAVRPPRGYLLRDPAQQIPPRPAVHREPTGQLLLTEYLEAGKVEEAQLLSRVNGSAFPEDIPSYSGFFTVDKSNGSNTFFWFFPAEHDYKNAPVVLWLQGGPGSTSLFGLFEELGPFSVAEDSSTLIRNPYSWHKNHSLLFIDNPVGAGFSYTTSDNYPTEETQIGKDLYSAMVQFFTLFPNLQSNDFFISGESYAGKFVPALGHTIHKNNPNASLKINLKGLIIGDGLVDPVHQLDYSDYVYQVGLVDNTTWKSMRTLEDEARQYIRDKDFKNAAKMWSKTVMTFVEKSLLSYYNILYDVDEDDGGDTTESYVDFLEKNSTRSALHVGSVPFYDIGATFLANDTMQSVAPWVEELLDSGYRVVFYNGQLDVVCAYPMAENMFRHLRFKEAGEYAKAERHTWGKGNHVYGYTKKAGGLTEVLVRNAGHMVPADQPAVAFDLIYKATRGTL